MPKLVMIFVATVLIALPVRARDLTCNKASRTLQVNVAKDLGRVVYDHSKSRSQFAEAAGGGIMSDDVAGTTVVNLQIDGTTEVAVMEDKASYCVSLNSVNVQMFLGDILVLMDRKYPVGSCEYNTVIAHENEHVNVARMVVDFYTPYVKKEIEKIVSTMEPVRVRKQSQADSVNRRYTQEITQRLQPLLSLIKEQLHKGNARIDTPENYARESAKCSNW